MFSKDSFIYRAHCQGEGAVPSSKRFWGAIMVGCSQLILIIAVTLSFIKGTGITLVLKSLIELNIITGSSLIGLTSVARIFDGRGNRFKERKGEDND